jgi:hypothetical protein
MREATMTARTPVTGLHTVGVPVTLLDRALAIDGALGFEIRLHVPMFAFRDQDGNGLDVVEAGTRSAGRRRS